MIDRHAARILAMQALCQFESGGESFRAQLDEFLADESALDDGGVPSEASQAYAKGLFERIEGNTAEFDAPIQAAAANWDMKRMSAIDRNILRVGVCELVHHHAEVPASVVINEAVEIAKSFGTKESGRFVNGVLDAVYKNLPAGAASRGAANPE